MLQNFVLLCFEFQLERSKVLTDLVFRSDLGLSMIRRRGDSAIFEGWLMHWPIWLRIKDSRLWWPVHLPLPQLLSIMAQMKYVRLGNSGLKVSRISTQLHWKIAKCSPWMYVLWLRYLGKMGFEWRQSVTLAQSCLGRRDSNLGHCKYVFQCSAREVFNNVREFRRKSSVKQSSNTIFLGKSWLFWRNVISRLLITHCKPGSSLTKPIHETTSIKRALVGSISLKLWRQVWNDCKQITLMSYRFIVTIMRHPEKKRWRRFMVNTPLLCLRIDLVEMGKVRYIGASSMHTYQFLGLQHIAEKNGWTKFISMQNFYNLIYREEEREMLPACKELGVGLVTCRIVLIKCHSLVSCCERRPREAERDDFLESWDR